MESVSGAYFQLIGDLFADIHLAKAKGAEGEAVPFLIHQAIEPAHPLLGEAEDVYSRLAQASARRQHRHDLVGFGSDTVHLWNTR